ncbi:hypothetical protein ACIBUY_04055 [Streptomyces sp. NPDC050085]|uniref:hypothetical protein n=1 Tax=Streptomyces sp. NPDC050085 TaxID=3365600 RepID=UPI00379D06D3
MDMEAAAFATIKRAIGDGVMNLERFDQVLAWGGRIAGPHLLSEAWDAGVIDGVTVTARIGDVWSLAEFPDAALGHARWRELFRVAGFTRNCEPAERPDQPLELWRGSVAERCRDWSWSTDHELALKYARGGYRRPPGRLYRMVAPPPALLAAYDGRGESEYVVDTDGILIEERRPDSP